MFRILPSAFSSVFDFFGTENVTGQVLFYSTYVSALSNTREHISMFVNCQEIKSQLKVFSIR